MSAFERAVAVEADARGRLAPREVDVLLRCRALCEHAYNDGGPVSGSAAVLAADVDALLASRAAGAST